MPRENLDHKIATSPEFPDGMQLETLVRSKATGKVLRVIRVNSEKVRLLDENDPDGRWTEVEHFLAVRLYEPVPEDTGEIAASTSSTFQGRVAKCLECEKE